MVYQIAGLRWRLFLSVCLGAGLAWHFQDSLLPLVRRLGDWVKSPQDIRSIIPGAALLLLLLMWVPWIRRYRASFPASKREGTGADIKSSGWIDWPKIRCVFRKWFGVGCWIIPAVSVLVSLVWLWSLARGWPNEIRLPANNIIYAETIDGRPYDMMLVDNTGRKSVVPRPEVDRWFYHTSSVEMKDGVLVATPGFSPLTPIISGVASLVGLVASYYLIKAGMGRARKPLHCF